jgi:hypothetical protein
MIKLFKHLMKIIKHKYYVCQACFKIGLYWKGIKHDISKFMPCELIPSVKYFQDTSSPIDAEKAEKGYSMAWQHHKRANSHHWEYWLDYKDGELVTIKIPLKDVYELVCDWIGAGRAYNTTKWTKDTPFEYWTKNQLKFHFHPDTRYLIHTILYDISQNGWDCTSLVIRTGYYQHIYDTPGMTTITMT